MSEHLLETEKALLEYLVKNYQPEVDCLEAVLNYKADTETGYKFCSYRIPGLDDKCPCKAILDLQAKGNQ